MTQKQAIEKLARILCQEHHDEPSVWKCYRSEAGAEFRRMVNERACALRLSYAHMTGEDRWTAADYNRAAINETIALIEALEE